MKLTDVVKYLYAKVPRWLILVTDVFFILFSFYCAYLLRFNFDIPAHERVIIPYGLLTYSIIRALLFLVTKTYKGMVRYTSSSDILRIIRSLGIGSLLVFAVNFYFYITSDIFALPNSIIIIEFFLSSFILIISRLIVKALYFEMRFSDKPRWDVIIYGAGELGVMAKRTLDRDRGAKYNIVAFVDRDKKKTARIIEGVKVYDYKKFESLIHKIKVSHLIMASSRLSVSQKKELIDISLLHNITVRDVPPLEKWINGELSFNQIKKVKIEELLGRDEINIDLDNIGQTLNDKTIFLSGAAGSIGSEIARQILAFSPKKLILFDQAESALYELDLELKNLFKGKATEIVIGDVSHYHRVHKLFLRHKPEIVFHAAAYKHVPLLESNASEAIQVNVQGTKNLADLAHTYKSEKFIMVSTDKAVNPTNVMGCSKRIAEIYVQGLNAVSKTQYITTRFGNVLGSNGSVIPLFRKQIAQGGPVTVTHPDITRYFMTIPEACKLVLEAGCMGKGGEIFVFNMGESVKIIDLAKKMIQLSGLEVKEDIDILFTGLRPGEKLYEELFTDKETMIKTHHPDIFISKVFVVPLTESTPLINELIEILQTGASQDLLPLLKKLVTEYTSEQNEIFA